MKSKAKPEGRRKKEFDDPEVAKMLKKMGKRFQHLRKEMGYTSQEIFAYEKNINRVQYSRYERGEDLRVSTLISLLKVFDITLEEFFSEGFE